MTTLEPRVAIFEDNATRADLYERWLSGFDVRTASTRREALEVLDETVAVAILDEEFGDGAAEAVLETVRSRNPDCRVLTTSPDREQIYPSFDVENHLAKPIFEAELREKVERLAKRALYCTTLKRYYALTMELTSVELGEDEDELADARRERLEDRIAELKSRLDTLTGAMDPEDFHGALADLKPEDTPAAEPAQDSKYVPRKCSRCNVEWRGDESTSSPVRLGSFVWRCTDCGHVQMHGNPNEGEVARLR